jgi:hypothetical protein
VIHGLAKVRDKSSSIPVYRTMVDEEMTRQLSDLYNHDFTERIIDDDSIPSREDQQFIQSVTDSIKHKEDRHYEIGLPLKTIVMVSFHLIVL